MSTSVSGAIRAGLEEIESSWRWFVALGSVLGVLGVIWVAGSATATRVTVIALGWMLLASCGVAVVQAIQTRRSRGFLLSLLSAVLRGFTGYLLLRYPPAGELGLTLLLASFFIAGGAFRGAGAGLLRFPQWGWITLSGVVSVVLGAMLLGQLPGANLWFTGLAICVDLVLDGTSLVALGLTLRSAPPGRPLTVA